MRMFLCMVVLAQAAASDWGSFKKGLVWRDSQCRDIANTGRISNVTCQAMCDSTSGCTALNAIDTGGPCALRACRCGEHLVPVPGSAHGTEFTAYIRTSCNNAPRPMFNASFSNLFGSIMVLQRAPMQARVFGPAGPLSDLTVSMNAEGDSGVQGGTYNTNVQADTTGHWELGVLSASNQGWRAINVTGGEHQGRSWQPRRH
jgi:hypothetical protein